MSGYKFLSFSLIFVLLAVSWNQAFGRKPVFRRHARQLFNYTPIEYHDLGVELHNDVRAEHSSPPLKLNLELQAAAQSHADYLINSTSFTDNETDSEPYAAAAAYEPYAAAAAYEPYAGNHSQNLFFTSNEIAGERPLVAIFLAMVHWYDEESRHNYTHPTPSNFTRMVWKASTDVGFGVATLGNNTVVVVNYAPAPRSDIDLDSAEGAELIKENVLQPKDDEFYF